MLPERRGDVTGRREAYVERSWLRGLQCPYCKSGLLRSSVSPPCDELVRMKKSLRCGAAAVRHGSRRGTDRATQSLGGMAICEPWCRAISRSSVACVLALG